MFCQLRQSIGGTACNQQTQDVWVKYIANQNSRILPRIKQFTRDPNVIEDCMQTVWLGLTRAIIKGDYDPNRARLQSWVSTIEEHAILNFFGKSNRISRLFRNFRDGDSLEELLKARASELSGPAKELFEKVFGHL